MITATEALIDQQNAPEYKLDRALWLHFMMTDSARTAMEAATTKQENERLATARKHRDAIRTIGTECPEITNEIRKAYDYHNAQAKLSNDTNSHHWRKCDELTSVARIITSKRGA